MTAFFMPLEGQFTMPETEETEQQPVGEPQETETALVADDSKTDPWSDPDAARKEIEKLRRESASYRTKVRDLEPLAAKAKELEDEKKTEAERLTEQLGVERDRAATATRAAVASKVEALAAKDFADPEDAAGALDLTAYVGEDGSIDSERIKADLAALLERKPHWARQAEGPRRPAPDRTQGSSGNGARTPTDPANEFANWFDRARKGL